MMNRILLLFALLLIPVWLLAQETGLPPAEIPESLAIILGVIAPLLIQLISKKVASAEAKLGISVLLSAVVGFAGALWKGLDFTFTAEFMVWVFAVSQAAYNLFWKTIIFPNVEFLKSKK
jgi:hypothetical protein